MNISKSDMKGTQTMVNKDDHVLIQNYISSLLFSKDDRHSANTPIEFVLKPECNQKCEYCYITKCGSSLYPLSQRVSNDKITQNVSMLLEYFLQNKCYLSNIELFAGDLFYDNFFFEIIEVFYDYYLKIFKINPFLFANKKARITIPCNFSFCEDEEKINKFKEIFNKFLDINIYIFLSYSSDGIYSTNIREKRELSETFIHNVFSLIYDCGYYGAHPMISYEGIDHAIENYEWWKNQFIKYNKIYNRNEKQGIIPCSLEVRNEGWDNESIAKYINLLDHMVNDRLALCDYDLEWLAHDVFCRDTSSQKFTKIGPVCMDPIKIVYSSIYQNYATCNLGHGLVIQCNNLTLIPCHRLAYPFYHGARFTIKNNIVENIEALDNLSGYFNLIHTNKFFSPKCATCDYQRICIKGCCGAQFEAMSDPNVPIADVCKLLQSKANFLLEKYSKLGILDIAIKNNYLTDVEIALNNKILQSLKKERDNNE